MLWSIERAFALARRSASRGLGIAFTAEYAAQKKLKENVEALIDFEGFLTYVSVLPEADINMLALFPIEMDPGEQQMLAILVNTPEVEHMVTGDKRALRLIGGMCAKDPALDQRLNLARVDCLESIMLAFIEKFGFETINVKAMCGIKSDKVLQASFGAKTLERNSREALSYYLDDVRRDASFLTGA